MLDKVAYVAMRVEDMTFDVPYDTMPGIINCDRCEKPLSLATHCLTGFVDAILKYESNLEIVCNRCIIPELKETLDRAPIRQMYAGSGKDIHPEVAADITNWAIEAWGDG